MFLTILAQTAATSPLYNPEMLVMVLLGGLGIMLIQQGMGQQQENRKQHTKGLTVGLGMLAVIGVFVLEVMKSSLSLDHLLLLGFGMMSIFGGIGLISFREPVHAALGFALAVLSVGGIFLIQSAPFVAASTVIVYAGATIIIFLFVLMFAQSTHSQIQDVRLTAPLTGVILGLVLLWMLQAAILAIPIEVKSPHAPIKVVDLGRVMYTEYLYAVEIAGTLLLIATVGAISIGQRQVVNGQRQATSSRKPVSVSKEKQGS